VLTLLLPAAFFAAVDRGLESLPDQASYIVNDASRHMFLSVSRGLAVILLAVYVASRVYLHDPPGDKDTLAEHPDAPLALLDEEEHLILKLVNGFVSACLL
jgi:Ca2+:H+ antiporter